MNARAVERDDWFDSAKLAILALVVFGHFLDHYSRSSWVASQIFVAIYLFHMPAIIFLAGYFTKGPARPDHFQRVLQRALLPYLIFQTLYSLQFTAQPFSALQYIYPAYALWFLLSLFWWQAAMPYLRRVPYVLPIAIGLALTVGMVDAFGARLSLSRTLVFLPFFLAGHFATPEHIARLRALPKALAALCLFGAIALFLTVMPENGLQLAFGRLPFSGLTLSDGEGVVARAAQLVLATIAALGFLALVPPLFARISQWGRATVYIYLLHLPLMWAVIKLGLLPAQWGWQAAIFVLGISALSLWAFSRPLVVALTSPLVTGSFATGGLFGRNAKSG